MALTELQLPDKLVFYAKLQASATEMNRLIDKWKNIAEFIGMVDNADLDAMGVPLGQVRTDMIAFRTVMDEMISFYEGNAVTQTNAPNAVVDKVRSM